MTTCCWISQTTMFSSTKVHSAIPCNLAKASTSDVRSYFQNTYDLYEDLFQGIRDESAYYKYPNALRLPLIFYYGHTAAVYINKLVLAGLIKERVHFNYESLFETGVDEMSWDDMENFRMGGKLTWPSLSEVQKYRNEVRQTILNLIDNKPLVTPVTKDSPWWSLFMGMEHERIHFETSSVLIRQLPIGYVTRPPNWVYGPLITDVPVTKNPLLKVNNSKVTIGKPRDFPSYGWDNEYGQWTVRVPAFEANKYPVTNREFLEFVKAGGYEDKTYWSGDGSNWRSFYEARHPTFWVCNQACKSGCGNDLADYSHCCLATNENDSNASIDSNGNQYHFEYKYRAIFDVIDMPLDWPAEVNYFEAKAYCTWKGPEYRLLTEAEHHAIRGLQKPLSIEDELSQSEANNHMRYGSCTPVNLFPANEAGFHDVFGNVWCWLEDQFNGLPGFETDYLYDDYSTPSFDGKHKTMLGGSWATTGTTASRFTRFAFRPHFFQHVGFRVARSVTSDPSPVRPISTAVYVSGVGVETYRTQIPGVLEGEARYPSANKQYINDTEEFINEELLKHYGVVAQQASDPFIDVCLEYVNQCNSGTESALNLMCSVGRQAFELSKHFDKVLGVDYSGRVIDAALKIKKGERIGGTNLDISVDIPEGVNAERITFKQFTWLPNEIGNVNVVLFIGLSRLTCPKAWLVRMREIVKPHGLLITEVYKDCNKEAIASYLGDRFKFVGEKILRRTPGSDKNVRPSDKCQSNILIWLRH